VNLYRGKPAKFDATVQGYLRTSEELAKETAKATTELQKQFKQVHSIVNDFAAKYLLENKEAKTFADLLVFEEYPALEESQNELISDSLMAKPELESVAKKCKAIRKLQDKLIKQLLDTISVGIKDYQLTKNKDWKELNLKKHSDQLKELQQQLSGNPDEEEPGLLHDTEYFWKQAHWLQSRFPDGVYTDVEGLCKVVTQAEIEARDWSLSPGRYVGVDAIIDDGVDYEERLREIHIEFISLNEEAVNLANTISENYKDLTL
jgi:type I restriction enzyme M protein